jgi:hypothetical protein
MNHYSCVKVLAFVLIFFMAEVSLAAGLERVRYNNPGLVVDLGVGLWAWPLPMDYDGDGDNDLVVVCPDTPYNGAYLFENTEGKAKLPVFKPAAQVGRGMTNVQVSYVDGQARLLVPGKELVDFRNEAFGRQEPIYPKTSVHVTQGRLRANQWKYADYDGDGAVDLIVGVEDWADYGWDDAFDKTGHWTRGPLHGLVYFVRNTGSTEAPRYAEPRQVEAAGKPIDVFGMPSPNFADFDGDGDLDLICGEFLDKFTYFQNVGTRTKPEYAAGQRLVHDGRPIAMDLEMIVPTAIDWDQDGDVDLIVGDEDGRVALVEHTGKVVDGQPQFLPPVYFQQQAAEVKFGALATPVGFDWDGDGDEDLICGNTAGYIGFIENLDGGNPPRWAAPRRLEATGKTIRIEAGPNGSIQGPCEAKWGYTTVSVADWDGDGLPDIVANSIWGKVEWYRNVGTRKSPQLAAAAPIEVEWAGAPPKPAWNWWNPAGKQLVVQWRTTPVAIDFTGDGLCDLAMLDHEGFLALFERKRHGDKLVLLPGQRIFAMEDIPNSGQPMGEPLRLNPKRAGGSGRRKLSIVDWDGDGKLDLLINSANADLLKGLGTVAGYYVFRDLGLLDDRKLAGHDTSPTTVDWNRDGVRDLLIGAEDGYFYYKPNLAK